MPNNPPCQNHSGAKLFAGCIDEYIPAELAAGSIIGPCSRSTFEIPSVVSPLSTTEKKDSDPIRVIMD